METTRTIGGNLFSLSLLGYEETCDLQPLLVPALADFMRLYAMVAGEGAKILDREGLDQMEVGAAVLAVLPELTPAFGQASEIIATLAAKLPADKLRTIRRTLLRGATMDGKPLYALSDGGTDMIGLLMRGRTIDGWKLLLFAIEVNYPDFFALARSFGGGGKKASPPSNSTNDKPNGGQGVG